MIRIHAFDQLAAPSGRIRRHVTSLLRALLLVAGVSLPSTASAQVGIAVAAVAGRTDEPDLPRPAGASVSAVFFPAARFSVRGELTMARTSLRLDGPLCSEPFAPPSCVPWRGEARSTLRTAALLGSLSVLRMERLRVQGGAGISATSVSGHFRPLAAAAARVPAEGASGTAFPIFAALTAKPFAARPIWLSLEYRVTRGLELDGCATDSYTPFCTTVRLEEIRIGVSYEAGPRDPRR